MPWRAHALAVLGVLVCTAAGAQTDTALERQTEEAFRKVLEQPADLAQWSRYAQLLVQAGNYEGGIAALERLMLQPNAPAGLGLEVAVLYYRLGSYAMAEGLARRALDNPGLTPEQRALGQSLLADVAKRNQPNQLSGRLTLGLRGHSNPGYRSDEAEVLSNGVLVANPAEQRPKSDRDVNLGLRVRHVYDLDLQNSAAISSTLGAYVVDYRSSRGSQLQAVPTQPYDLQLLSGTTGVEFKPLPAALSSLTLRPHILLSTLAAQQHRYLRTEGLGIDATLRIDERTLAEFTVDDQRRTYYERIDVPNAALVSGHQFGFRASVSRELRPGQVLSLDYGTRNNRTYSLSYDYEQHEARLSYVMSYGSPMASDGTWSTTAWIGGLRRNYEAADPTVDPGIVRRDTEWRLGISQAIALAEQWHLVLSVEHLRNRSELPNFRYRNTVLSGAIARTF